MDSHSLSLSSCLSTLDTWGNFIIPFSSVLFRTELIFVVAPEPDLELTELPEAESLASMKRPMY